MATRCLPPSARSLLGLVAAAAVVWLGAGATRADDDPFVAEVAPFLERYCFDCHEGESSEAGVDLSRRVTLADAQARRARWNQIRGLIGLGAMPPADHDPLPTAEERQAMADRIDQLINRVDCGVDPDPGRVTMRRLNRVEYDNTVRDLMHVDFRPSSVVGLPSDDVGNGFDNQGEVLASSPLLIEKYLKAAREITNRAIVADRGSLRQQASEGDSLFVGGRLDRGFWTASGRYRIRVEVGRYNDRDESAVPVDLLVDGRVVHSDEVGMGGRLLEAWAELTEGSHQVGVRFVDDTDDGQAILQSRQLRVNRVRLHGPEKGKPAYPPSHTRLLIASPGDPSPGAKGKKLSPREAARLVFQNFLPRAYRRPAEPLEIERLVGLSVAELQRGASYEQAIALGVQAALVSPHFLFLVEPATAAPAPVAIDDYQLASRLSYFLWASMPDDELFKAAERGDLADPKKLERQALRMLDAPGADTLVTRFFSQWFGLTGLDQVSPNPQKFPTWNTQLREAAREETFRLCRTVLDEDRSLLELFDANYTFLNPRLAELYGEEFLGQDPVELYLNGPGFPIEVDRRRGPRRGAAYLLEDRWVRASAPKGRRGVMTHASVLALTSNPGSTSPVKRGQWVLDVVLGASPPPAPPSVPSLEETAADAEDRPLRDQLALHRSDPSCASCHQQMDPIGLGLENFDAIGRWRDTENDHPIDPSGEFDGQAFQGPGELLAILRGREKEIARNFVRRLMTYALGRGLRPADECAVDEIVAEAEPGGYIMSRMITGVVLADPFRMHGAVNPEAVPVSRTATRPE